MARGAPQPRAHVGVFDHGGWAILVTVTPDGTLIDRRRVELVSPDLPSLPHHVQGQALPLDEAVALVERVTRSAEACASACLETLAKDLSVPIAKVALRALQPLPATVAERLTNYRARNVADWVMYRVALAQNAEARGFGVYFYEAKSVLLEAARVLGKKSIEALLKTTGEALGPPWQKDHRLAMAAAIAAGGRAAPRFRGSRS